MVVDFDEPVRDVALLRVDCARHLRLREAERADGKNIDLASARPFSRRDEGPPTENGKYQLEGI